MRTDSLEMVNAFPDREIIGQSRRPGDRVDEIVEPAGLSDVDNIEFLEVIQIAVVGLEHRHPEISSQEDALSAIVSNNAIGC